MLCLKVPTDAAWATAAIRDIHATLVDHAHCEMKAATNALSLAMRHSADVGLVLALTQLAQEELGHFRRVVVLLAARGVALGPPPVDAYAAEVRRAVSTLPRDPHAPAVVDRLLVGAVIEARSCERFQLLVAASDTDELCALWNELLASEARHYRTFVDLAVRAVDGDRARVVARLERLSELEAAIVTGLAERGGDGSRASIHG
jgi:tRNA 2-(methylsulfanyl)-N6-isopentenyladenosine37 hydroxylase